MRSAAQIEKMYKTYNKLYDQASEKQQRAGYGMASPKLTKEEYKFEIAAIDEDIKAGRYRADTSHVNRDIVSEQSYELSQQQARAAYKALKEWTETELGEKFEDSLRDVRHMSMKDEDSMLRMYIEDKYAEFKKDGKIVYHGKEYTDWKDFMGENVVGSK
jgi:hypothetical protein